MQNKPEVTVFSRRKFESRKMQVIMIHVILLSDNLRHLDRGSGGCGRRRNLSSFWSGWSGYKWISIDVLQ